MPQQFVSAQQLAETYTRSGWEAVEQYRTATQLRAANPDMPRAEIARRVERAPSAVRGWLSEGKRPEALSGIETARDRGWLDIEQSTERFRAMNALIAWIFSGGGISDGTYVPSFSVDDLVALTTIDQLFARMGISYTIRDEGPSHSYELIPAVDASVLGRILSTLGAPVGVKAQDPQLSLPAYLERVSPQFRRDFARVYLFNRLPRLDTPDSNWFGESRAPAYRDELATFLSTVTGVDISPASQERLWVPPDAIRALCATSSRPFRPTLATQIAYGSATPPTPRALQSTYRDGKRPGGLWYARAYRITTETPTPVDEIATTYDIHPATVRNWFQGSTPRVVETLRRARDYGWLGPAVDPDTRSALVALAAWILGAGTLRKDSFHPVFRATMPLHHAWFRRLAERLSVSYRTRLTDDESRPTEFHLSADGSVLGRLLYTLGVPTTAASTGPLPGPVLFVRPRLAQAYLVTWCLHHGAVVDEQLQIPLVRGVVDRLQSVLAEIAQQCLDWEVDVADDGALHVAYATARPSFIATLGSELTAEFETDS